jgi:hypothetical protein
MIIFSLILSIFAVGLSIFGFLNSLKARKMSRQAISDANALKGKFEELAKTSQKIADNAKTLKEEFEQLTWDKF